MLCAEGGRVCYCYSRRNVETVKLCGVATGWSFAKPNQAKVLTGGGDLRETQVNVPLSVSHSCV